MAIERAIGTLRAAADLIAADLRAATGDDWHIAVDLSAGDADGFVVTAGWGGRTCTGTLSASLDEDDWEWDDLDAEILPTTLWHDAAETVWDVVDGAFFCWANVVPACPRATDAPLVLASGVWVCRTHAHDVARVGELLATDHA